MPASDSMALKVVQLQRLPQLLALVDRLDSLIEDLGPPSHKQADGTVTAWLPTRSWVIVTCGFKMIRKENKTIYKTTTKNKKINKNNNKNQKINKKQQQK